MKTQKIVDFLKVIFTLSTLVYLCSCADMQYNGRDYARAMQSAADFYKSPSGDTYQPYTLQTRPSCGYNINGVYVCN